MAKNLCHGLHTRQIRGEFREESATETGKERIFTELAASEHSTTHEGLSVETAQEDRLNQDIKERESPSFRGPKASSQHPCKVTHNCL